MNCCRSKSHSHAMILVSLDNGTCLLFHVVHRPRKGYCRFCHAIYTRAFSSLFKGFDPSVSFILRLCSPVKRKGTLSSAQVTTKVCARSGISTKSSSSRSTHVPFFFSRIPVSVYSVATPRRANTSAPRLSPDNCGGTVRSVLYLLGETGQLSDTSKKLHSSRFRR